MQKTKKNLLFPVLAGLSLCVSLARITQAQGPGGQGQNGQNGQGGQGGRRGGFQGQGGGRGGFGGQMPFAMGTITGGDANARTITIQSQFGGQSQTIQLGTTTQMVTQATVSASDLNVGDQIQVQGVPTGISASAVTVGQMPSFMQGGGRGGPGGFGGPNGGGQGANGGQNNAGGGGQGANARTAFASATGKVVSTSPLTISLGNDVTMSIKMATGVKVMKIAQVAFSSLKVGDRVTASGQAGADGSFAATGIAVNMNMGGGMGMGGPGGFGGGPGGQGGPGGFGPGGGPGGQGGPGGGGPGGPGGDPGGPPPDNLNN